jgi:hypothetical protein
MTASRSLRRFARSTFAGGRRRIHLENAASQRDQIRDLRKFKRWTGFSPAHIVQP